MPVATPEQIQSMIAKDQPAPIPERVMKEFADLQDLLQRRDPSADLYEYEASLSPFQSPRGCPHGIGSNDCAHLLDRSRLLPSIRSDSGQVQPSTDS